MTTNQSFFALYRGESKAGVLQVAWKQLNVLNEEHLSLEMAKRECEGMFGSGLMWNSSTAQFRILDHDHKPIFDARPPHTDALDWQPTTAGDDLEKDLAPVVMGGARVGGVIANVIA